MQEELKTRDPVREFLESYWELRKEHRRLERKIRELESQCQSVTAKYSALPGGGGGNGNSAWDALVEARERAGAALTKTLYKEADIEQFINCLPEQLHRMLLKYRYLELLNWGTIAKKMNYSDRQLRRHHGDALQAARKLWKEQGR